MSLELIRKFKPAKFKMKDGDGRICFGFIVDDIEKLLPEEQFAVIYRDEKGFGLLDYNQFIAPIVKAQQELDHRLNRIEFLLKIEPEKPGECTCDCNYACTCNCNYPCTCLCNYPCTCYCNYACTCYCNYACTCNCNYCTCNCNYCTCNCNYACTCNCNYV